MNKFSKMAGMLAVATAAIGTVLLLSTHAIARSTLRETCHGSTISKVENCCDAWVAENGRPFLWLGSHKSCGAKVVCGSVAPNSRIQTSAIVIPPKKAIVCQIVASMDHSDGRSHAPSNPPPQTRPTPPPAEPEVPR